MCRDLTALTAGLRPPGPPTGTLAGPAARSGRLARSQPEGDAFTRSQPAAAAPGGRMACADDGSAARAPPAIIAVAFLAIMIVGAFVLPLVSVGMMDASATRSPSGPRTRRCGSTTAISSMPNLHVPTGW